MDTPISLIFDGGQAASGRLDLYDAATSLKGAARVYSILGHYYQTGNIIHQAPRSVAEIYITPPEYGSFRQQIIVGVAAATISAPFAVFATRVIDRWLPPENSEMREVIDLLREQNELLRRGLDKATLDSVGGQKDDVVVDQFLDKNINEIQVIRSIVSVSLTDMFRPVGRSADHLAITHGLDNYPVGALDVSGVQRLEDGYSDDADVVVVGVVNSFSRGSKTGVLFSRQMERGVLFEYKIGGKMPPGDDFSWSQYTRKPLEMTGKFYRFFDGTIKKFYVYEVKRIIGD